MSEILSNILFTFQRLDWLAVFDMALVTLIFFMIFKLIRGTQAVILLRGILFVIVLLLLMTSLFNLPAFRWLVQSALPALFLAIPVIFAPEIRRGLERLGRMGYASIFWRSSKKLSHDLEHTIHEVALAADQLSNRKHGALIVLQRNDSLDEQIQTGVRMNAEVTEELLLQIFYPKTPLHDGAAIVVNNRIVASACVLPLSTSSEVLNKMRDRQMGLRHRAGIGVTEVSDAVVVIVSEQTGQIAVTHAGRMLHRLDIERLENILSSFLRTDQPQAKLSRFQIKPKKRKTPRKTKDRRAE
ncbi:MAG: diadenylate cyclase CdaA [Anaerolineaceae bacterium]|nr:diadenylate cyclase CdaA [Anaerolineaceae bacterium]